ncbi:hypothetical protein AX16_000669, partial [Volvariella volvacea WC 439]
AGAKNSTKRTSKSSRPSRGLKLQGAQKASSKHSPDVAPPAKSPGLRLNHFNSLNQFHSPLYSQPPSFSTLQLTLPPKT